MTSTRSADRWIAVVAVALGVVTSFVAAPAAADVLKKGRVITATQPVSCDAARPGLNAECQDLEIECIPALAKEDALASLRVTEPPGGVTAGTIVMTVGGGGNGFWGNQRERNPPDPPGPDYAAGVVESLVGFGYRTVELSWPSLWNNGIDDHNGPPSGQPSWEGPANLACRVAAAVAHIDNFIHASSEPLCATGQSGGAVQLSYTLTHYGMDDRWTNVVLTSGPTFADLVLGCEEVPGCRNAQGCYSDEVECLIDWSYGNPELDCRNQIAQSYGPCQTDPLQPAFVANAADQSVVNDPLVRWDYVYPDTRVDFIKGDDDGGSAPAQLQLYYDKLDFILVNDVSLTSLPGVAHGVPETEDGTDEVLAKLLAGCV